MGGNPKINLAYYLGIGKNCAKGARDGLYFMLVCVCVWCEQTPWRASARAGQASSSRRRCSWATCHTHREKRMLDPSAAALLTCMPS